MIDAMSIFCCSARPSAQLSGGFYRSNDYSAVAYWSQRSACHSLYYINYIIYFYNIFIYIIFSLSLLILCL